MYYLGVDFGSQQDYTAMALVRRVPRLKEMDSRMFSKDEQPAEYHLLYLRQVELGTPYSEIVSLIQRILRDDWIRGDVTTIADATGVGLPVIQMMRERGISPLIPISIHGGVAVNSKQDGYSVPKRDLVVSMQMVVESRRLRVASDIQHKEQFVKELQSFTMKTSKTGVDTYEALMERNHDDLVLAVSYALWYAEKTMGSYIQKLTPTPPENYDLLKR